MRYAVPNKSTTNLFQLFTSSPVSIYAPEKLREEVMKNIPKLSKKSGINKQKYLDYWNSSICNNIMFLSPSIFPKLNSDNELFCRDKTDIDYFIISEGINADLLLSFDNDFIHLNLSPTNTFEVISQLKILVEKEQIFGGVCLGGTVILSLSAEIVKNIIPLFYKLFNKLWDVLKSIPWWGYLIVIGIISISYFFIKKHLSMEKIRLFLSEKLDNIEIIRPEEKMKINNLVIEAVENISQFMDDFDNLRKIISQIGRKIKEISIEKNCCRLLSLYSDGLKIEELYILFDESKNITMDKLMEILQSAPFSEKTIDGRWRIKLVDGKQMHLDEFSNGN